MKKTTVLTTTALLLSGLYLSPVNAGWGDFLDDVTNVGKSLLSADNSAIDSNSLDANTIVAGLKQALDIGAKQAIDNVSKKDGYLANELIRIAMPPELEQLTGLMKKFGLSAQADAFEQSINHAAEKAAPQATNIIIEAIKDMSIEDANTLLRGADDSATQYFKDKTYTQLSQLFQPTITDSLNQVGSTKYYNNLADQVSSLPLVGETINLDLPSYVTEQALNGLFTMIAVEEKKIRDNPTARTTQLLKQVFAN